MTPRGGLGLAGWALAACSLLTGCGSGWEEQVRYKMTVEVETPDGVVSGSAVRAIELNNEDCWYCFLGEGRPQVRVHGEAVTVDLPGGQVLFALLDGGHGESDYAAQIPGRALGSRLAADASRRTIDEPFEWRERAELYPNPIQTTKIGAEPLPMLVRFKDLGDPLSVEKVLPGALDAAFGPGVKLRRITIETTDDRVTSGIAKRLPWLLRIDGGYLDGGVTSRNAPLGLDGTAFSTETRRAN
jgi:hypothetical protein